MNRRTGLLSNIQFKLYAFIFRSIRFHVHIFSTNLFLIMNYFLFSNSLGLSSASIRVSLQVDPPSVSRGRSATFICTYDLQGAPLYSVKFYRGVHEFYRYSPSEVPTGKIFQFPGFNVDVSIHFCVLLILEN